MRTADATVAPGARLAESLGLTIIGTEGHDLKVGCPFCPSSDAGRVDQVTGAYFCYSCQQKASGFDLCKLLGRDHKAAVALMREVGLFETYMSPGGNERLHAPAASRNGKPAATPVDDEAAYFRVCELKRMPPDAVKKYGGEPYKGGVRIPMWGPDLKVCSSIHITPENGKGMYAKGNPTGIFLPGRSPDPGERWLIVEGPKDAGALFKLGHLVAGLPGNRMKADFGPLFTGIDVVILADGDKAGREGAAATAKLLRGVARSVKVGTFPDGKDARDVLTEQGLEGISRVLLDASEGGEGDDGPPLNRNDNGKARAAATLKPGSRVRAGDRGNIGEIVSDNGSTCVVHFVSPEGQHAEKELPKSQLASIDGRPVDGSEAEGPPRFITTLMTSAQLDDLKAEPRFIVQNAVPVGQVGATGGKSKCCKTGVDTDLTISVASATRFLDEFEVPEPAPVLNLCGESGASKIRRQARHICEARGLALRELPIFWGFDLPKLCLPTHVDALAEFIGQNKIALAIIDPLYLSLFTQETAGRSGDLYTMGATFEPLTAVCRETGAAILLTHHFRKNRNDDQQEPCSLEELSQAGLAEVARWWLLLDRREPYAGDGRHALWLRVGGSEGHASFWSLDIDEGLTVDSEGNQRTIRWETTLGRVQDAKAEEKRQRETRKAAEIERRDGEYVDKLVLALRKYPGGQTARQLRADARLNGDSFLRAVAVLQQAGRIEEITIAKYRGNYDGFKLK